VQYQYLASLYVQIQSATPKESPAVEDTQDEARQDASMAVV